MKKIIISVIFLFILNNVIQAQENIFTEVIDVDLKLTKNKLYANALSWFAVVFVSSKDVIQMSDSDAGKIIGKGIFDKRSFMITITCKDGRYKYEIYIDKKTDSFLEVNFNIDTYTVFGVGFKGKTIGKLMWVNDKISLSEIYFIADKIFNGWSGATYYATDPYPSTKWRKLVSKEIPLILEKYKDIDNLNTEENRVIIKRLTDNLKESMKKNDDF